MSIFRRLTRNAGLVLFAGVATKVFSFVFIAYAARVLGPHDFGIYALINTIAFLFPFFGNLGIGPMAIREMARERSRIEELFNHIISIRMTLVIVFYPILVGIIQLAGYSEEIRFLVYVTGLTAIVSTLSHSFHLIYIAREQFKFPSVMIVLVAFLTNVANIAVLYLGFGLKGLVIITLLGSIAGALISGVWIWTRVMRFRLVFDFAVWKDLISQSAPFAVLSFLQQASTQVNTLMLSVIPGAGPLAIGYYNPAISLCRQAMLIPNGFRQAALPTVSSNADNLEVIRAIIEKSSRYLVALVAFPLILITNFFPGEIISLIFGPKYLPAVPALVIFGWAFALQIYNAPVTVTLAASRQISKFIPWRFLIFSIDLTLALPLIWYFSFVGAALAFLISKIVETFLRYHLLKIMWGVTVDTRASLVRLISPMAAIFIVLLFAHFLSLGTVKFILLMGVLYVLYLYHNRVFQNLSGHILG